MNVNYFLKCQLPMTRLGIALILIRGSDLRLAGHLTVNDSAPCATSCLCARVEKMV